MKRRWLIVALMLSVASCGRSSGGNKLRVGATPVPAGEVLAQVQGDLASAGVEMEIVSFTDYIQPNSALATGDVDANLYQNVPFMEQFNRDRGTHFVSVKSIYLPLMAIYPGRSKSLGTLPEGGTVSLPNDPVNFGRGLLLLQSAGLLQVAAKSSAALTPADVTANPKRLALKELEAAQLPRSLPDVDAAVINANYALDAGLNPLVNTMFHEGLDSKYANVLVVNAGKEKDPRVQALARALTSDKVKTFLQSRYHGAVIPTF